MFSKKRSTRPRALSTKLDVEVREEIRFYLEMRAQELIKDGCDPDEAWRAAVAAFGEPESVAKECLEMNPKETHPSKLSVFIGGVGQDVRCVARSLTKSRVFTVVAVLTLAIGIGANTAIFSVVSGVLLQPLPYENPEELVAINSRWTPESGYDWPKYPVGSPEYFDYLNQNRTLAHVAAVSTQSITLTGNGDPEIVTGGAASSSMFSVLGTPPLLGRALVAEDDGAEPRPVFVLGYDLWQRRFGGDSSVIGQTLNTGAGVEFQSAGEIVGVMPQGFAFPTPDTQLWTTLRLDPARTWRGGHWFSMIGRRAPGVSFEEVDVEMQALMGAWAVEYPDHHVGHFLYVTPLLEDLVGNVRPALLLVFGAVGFVLLVACANVANLLLARGEGRRREIAVRRALGAGRGRLAQHLLLESALLAAVGGALAVVLAHVGTGALLAIEGGTIPRVETIGVDWRVLAFVGVTVVLATLLFGIVPALQAASPNLSDAFKDGGGAATGGPRRQHFRLTLTVSEIALAVLLVTGAGLVTKSFWTLLRQDPGIETDGLLYTRLSLPAGRYSPEEAVTFYARLAEAARGLPGVRHVGLVDSPPMAAARAWTRFDMLEDEESFDGAGHTASAITAGAGLFETLGISLRRGRLLNAADRVGTEHVVVVDEAMARRYWPGEDAIGKQIRFAATDGPFHRVVGIVDNVKFQELGAENPTFYYPYEQVPGWMWFAAGSMTLVIRAEGDPMVNAQPIREMVRGLDPDLPIVWMRTQNDLVAMSVARPRFMMTLLGVFAGVALVLAAVGVYGVMSHGVAQRTGEVGIRVALGAKRRDVARLIVRQGMTLALVGVGIGLAAALAATRVLRGFLFEVSPTDPWTYGVVSLVVAAVALCACYLPARRASRVDPMVALRVE